MDTAIRFRTADGFSHARSLAMLWCLAAVPFLIALTGLAEAAGMTGGGRVIAETVLALTPGRSDALVRRVLTGEGDDDTGEAFLWLGLLTGTGALISAMGQVQRGANRIFGISRDRPTRAKYGHATTLTIVAGLPAMLGFLVVVAGDPVADALTHLYPTASSLRSAWALLHWPVGLGLTVGAVFAIFRYAPRRRPTDIVCLLTGASAATALWVLTSVAVAVYVAHLTAFGEIYGPLTGVVALLVWANATSLSLFFGLALAAELEQHRCGTPTSATGSKPAQTTAPTPPTPHPARHRPR